MGGVVDEEIIKNVLLSLRQTDRATKQNVNDLQIEVLYWYCQLRDKNYKTEGKFYEDVGLKVGYGWQSVSNALDVMAGVFRHAGINVPSRMAFPREICTVLNQLIPIKDGRQQFTPWPPPQSVTWETLAPAGNVDPQPPIVTIVDEPNTQQRRNPILYIVGGLVGLVILYWLLDALLPITVTSEIEVTRIAEVTRIVPETVEVIQIVEQTRIVESVEEIPVTVETTRVVEVVQEVPVTVEVTPAPSATPTPTSLPQIVTISEDFNDGEIDPSITVRGRPILGDDILTMVEGEWIELEIGDDTWRNYSVEYDTFVPCRGDRHTVAVRYENPANQLLLSSFCNQAWWSDYSEGDNFEIPGSRVGLGNRVRIWTEDERLYYGDGAFVYVITGHESGRILIRLNKGWIDNLVITRND